MTRVMGFELMRWARGAAFVGLAAIVCLPVGAVAEGESANNYAALTAGFAQGDFGSAFTSKLYSLTVEAGHLGDVNEFSASLPMLTLRVEGGGQSVTESGIGDASLRYGRRLWKDDDGLFSVTGALMVKLATGDQDKGLGTGATDVGVQMSVARKTGAYSFTGWLGYTQVGSPSGVNYDNVTSYGIGVNRNFTRSNIFASLEGQTSAIPGGTAAQDIDMGFFHVLTSDTAVIAHAFIGLSDGSADNGGGLSIVRWF